MDYLMCLSVSAFWAFMWFVGFCLLANQWQVSKPDNNPLQEGGDAARAAIAFSFFSIFTWVCTGCYFFGFSESGLRKDFLFLEVMWLWYQAFVCVCVFQGALTLLSLRRLKRVCFEEEYEQLFTHQPPELTHTHANMSVWVCHLNTNSPVHTEFMKKRRSGESFKLWTYWQEDIKCSFTIKCFEESHQFSVWTFRDFTCRWY